MRRSFPILLLPLSLASACSDEKSWNVGEGSTTPAYQRLDDDPTLLGNTIVPVRIGELGPSFAACNSQGLARDSAGPGIPVRGAPYAQARETGRVAVGEAFFICSRSLDQGWLGIVYAAGGQNSRGCGVASPTNNRRDYDGACESGWVSSAQVQLISGVEPPPVQASANSVEPK